MSEKRIVTTPSLFQVDESFEDERFMKVRICAMAADTIANGTRFSVDCIKAAKDTFANIPVLANVVETKDKDGNTVLDYGSHDFHIEQDVFNDGESRIIYDEKVCGIVPEKNDFELVRNNKTGKDEAWVSAVLYRDYANYVCDILEKRGGKTSVSMEIDCDELSANEKDNCIDVNKMTACGVTMLGADVQPAFPTANAATFSLDENNRQEQLIQIMQELKESLDNYTAKVEKTKAEENKTLGKEETQMNKHFEELLAQYEKTAEEITFDYAEMSDEELDAAFAEAFEKDSDPEENAEVEAEGKTVEMSVKVGEETKTYAKSLTDVIYALTDLVNATYVEDGTYYSVDVYDSGSAKSKFVIMHDIVSGKHFRQGWNLKDGVYTLKNAREEVFTEYLSASERDQLEAMRQSYAAMSVELDKTKELLSKHEAEPQKMEVINAEAYASIKESEDYASLLNDHFDLSIEDLTAKLDGILLDYAKQGKINFANKDDEQSNLKVGSKTFPLFANGNGGRYGKLFS